MRVPTVKIKNGKTGVIRKINASEYALNMNMWHRKGYSLVGESSGHTGTEIREIQDMKPVSETKEPVNIEVAELKTETEKEVLNDSDMSSIDKDKTDVETNANVVEESITDNADAKPKRGRGRPKKEEKGNVDDSNKLQSDGIP